MGNRVLLAVSGGLIIDLIYLPTLSIICK